MAATNIPLRWSGKREADGRATNIPLRWSGKAEGRWLLQTFRSAGAGRREADGGPHVTLE